MRRVGYWIAAALVAFSVPALAGPPDNLRLYSILAGNAQLTIDGGKPQTIEPGTVNFYHFDPGAHVFVLTDADGQSITLNADLSDGSMATSRGRSWWCVTTGRTTNTNELRLLLDTHDQCQSMLAVAPEHDDPSDSTP